MSSRIVAITLLLAGLSLPGCGLAKARSSQDWTTVTDERLFRCCHVGNYGSGVLLLQDAGNLWVLTNAHLVDRVARIHYVDPATRRWGETTAWVVASGKQESSDFALLRADPLPGRAPFVTGLARPLADRESRDVELLPISVTGVPRAYPLPAVGRRCSFANPDPPHTPFDRDMMCVHGGVQQANSGTPVFDRERLLGLNELHPFDATLIVTGEDGQAVRKQVVGIGASTAQGIEDFLRQNGQGALADRLVDGR